MPTLSKVFLAVPAILGSALVAYVVLYALWRGLRALLGLRVRHLVGVFVKVATDVDGSGGDAPPLMGLPIVLTVLFGIVVLIWSVPAGGPPRIMGPVEGAANVVTCGFFAFMCLLVVALFVARDYYRTHNHPGTEEVKDESDYGKLTVGNRVGYLDTFDPTTHERVRLKVPPTMETAREAAAWTFNMKEKEYAPEVQV